MEEKIIMEEKNMDAYFDIRFDFPEETKIDFTESYCDSLACCLNKKGGSGIYKIIDTSDKYKTTINYVTKMMVNKEKKYVDIFGIYKSKEDLLSYYKKYYLLYYDKKYILTLYPKKNIPKIDEKSLSEAEHYADIIYSMINDKKS